MPPFTDYANGTTPTEAEARLIEAVRTGTEADCTDLPDADRVVSARLVAALATGRFVDENGETVATTEFGLRLLGATVPNRLDLENCHIPRELVLGCCILQDAFDLDGARLDARLVLAISSFFGECRLSNAVVQGAVIASEASFHNQNGTAVIAQRLKANAWIMDGASVIGAFDIAGAELEGQFVAERANFDNGGRIAVCAQDVTAFGWIMDGAEVTGEFAINSASLTAQFAAVGTTFKNGDRYAIRADYTCFRAGVIMRGKTRCVGSINFARATVDAEFDLCELTVISRNPIGAINLTGATIDADVVLGGATIIGRFDASRAHFTGRLSMKDASFVAASIAHRDGLFAEREGEAPDPPTFEGRHAAIVLHEARFDTRLVMPKQKVRGTIDLSRARCDTLEDFADGWPAQWPDPKKPRAARCDGRECVEEGGRTVEVQHLDLDGFVFTHLEHPSGVQDGDEKAEEHGGFWSWFHRRKEDGQDVAQARIRWLEAQSARAIQTHFNPQPWRQTAAVLRDMGYDEEAREILIRRRVRQRRADNTPLSRVVVSRLLQITSDYGFNPWKAVRLSGLIIAAFGLIYWYAASHCALDCRDGSVFSPIAIAERDPAILAPKTLADRITRNVAEEAARQAGRVPPPRAVVSESYPPFLPLLFSLDTFLPLIPLGIEEDWAPNGNYSAPLPAWLGGGIDMPWGWILVWVMVVQEILGAVLVAIAVSGFTGLLTRDER